MRRYEPATQREADPAVVPRAAEPQPADSLLALQRSAGNRAVSSLLARQPTPAQRAPSTSTLGLGEELGVIPLESANLGEGDRDGNAHDLHVTFVGNKLVPKLQEMQVKGTPVDEGFYSSTAMKLTLNGIVISAMQVTEDREQGGELVAMTLNCTSIRHEKAP